MQLRSEQIEALKASKVAPFEDRMVRHLSEWFPEKAAGLGEERIRELVRESRERASGYRIVATRDLAKFITVAFVLGPRFDERPEHPWAREILAGGWAAPIGEKVDMLCGEAVARVRAENERANDGTS